MNRICLKNNLYKLLKRNFSDSTPIISSHIKNVGVLGCGQMGTGIAYVFGR